MTWILYIMMVACPNTNVTVQMFKFTSYEECQSFKQQVFKMAKQLDVDITGHCKEIK